MQPAYFRFPSYPDREGQNRDLGLDRGKKRKFGTGFWRAGFAAAAVLITGTAQACIQPSELRADQVRFIDLQLKVAALQCRKSMAILPGLYNHFALSHGALIDASRLPLETYLIRQADGDIDGYFTRLANRVAFEAIGKRDFCRLAAAAAVASARGADPRDSINLMPVRYHSPMAVCAADRTMDTAQIEDQIPTAMMSIRR